MCVDAFKFRQFYQLFSVTYYRHCFDNVNAIIFISSLSEYDQTLREDNCTNRHVNIIHKYVLRLCSTEILFIGCMRASNYLTPFVTVPGSPIFILYYFWTKKISSPKRFQDRRWLSAFPNIKVYMTIT